MEGAIGWLLCNLFSIVTLGFYSMVEMACVSVNKSRLHFYAMNGNWKAQLLQKLLQNPSWLFSTTLIGVNLATVVGSECAREFHASLGIDPDFAPLSQVILVVIFGELAPMFAARKFSEHVALMGSPLLYLSAQLLFPFTWLIGHLTKFVDKVTKNQQASRELFLSKDELLKMVEAQQFITQDVTEDQEFSNIAASLFTLHTKTIRDLMLPLHSLDMLPTDATIADLRNLLKKNTQKYTPVYYRGSSNIIGIVQPRDILRAADHELVQKYAQDPWFVTTQTAITTIIHQFRRNNQRLAIILDSNGKAVGFVTFTAIINQVFGIIPQKANKQKLVPVKFLLQDKTLPASITVEEFNKRFEANLQANKLLTLGRLLTLELGHHPNRGDSIIMGTYKITAKETSLLDVKTVTVTSVIA